VILFTQLAGVAQVVRVLPVKTLFHTRFRRLPYPSQKPKPHAIHQTVSPETDDYIGINKNIIMKLTPSIMRKSGMTLLELTVVILVLLSLVSILFVGAQAWKKGTDRASCILNIRNVQQAVRGHQNLLNLAEGADLPRATIYSNTAGTAYLRTPVCPSAGVYDETLTKVPATGTLYLPCSKASVANGNHAPATYSEW